MTTHDIYSIMEIYNYKILREILPVILCGGLNDHLSPDRNLNVNNAYFRYSPRGLAKDCGAFLSTKFYLLLHRKRKKYKILTRAFALRQTRLLFVKNCRFLTYYPSRAPPSPILEKFQHKFQDWRITQWLSNTSFWTM